MNVLSELMANGLRGLIESNPEGRCAEVIRSHRILRTHYDNALDHHKKRNRQQEKVALKELRKGLLRILRGDTDSLSDFIYKDLIFEYCDKNSYNDLMILGQKLGELARPYRVLIALVERKLASSPQSLVGFANDLLYVCFG